MGIGEVIDSDFEGIIAGARNYEDKNNQIETPNGRTKQRTDALTDGEEAILRSELWGLMRISWIARPGAIYDASAEAPTFTEY